MRLTAARILLATAAVGAAVLAVPASAAPGGGGCQLDGTATFKNGPGTDPNHAFTYTFAGKLSSCQSNVAGAPTAGTIATASPTSGTGSCANGSTKGVAIVTWADKTVTVVGYTTTDAAAAVGLQGTVLKSVKVGKKVVKTTRYAGAQALGALAFEASPAECAGGGVKSAGIAGFVGIGSQ